MMIYRDEVYDDKTTEPGVAELIIGRHETAQWEW